MRLVSSVGTVLLLFLPALAFAQQTPAVRAFEEGRGLALKGNCAAAIDKFTQSITAEPSIGAYLNRGACRAQLGDPAHAWADYAHAEEIALAKGSVEDERLGLARKGAAALEPKLLKVVVQVPAGVDGVELRIDGDRFSVPRFAAGVAVDPATAHRVTAAAPSYTSWTREGVTGAAGSSVTLTASLEARAPATPAAPPATTPASPPSVADTPVAPAPRPQSQRTIGIVIGGLGVVGVAVGGVFGLIAQSKYNAAKTDCGSGYPSSCQGNITTNAAATDDNNSAKSAATASTVAFIVGGAALVAGGILFFTAPSSSGSAARLRLSPAVGAHAGGISVAADW